MSVVVGMRLVPTGWEIDLAYENRIEEVTEELTCVCLMVLRIRLIERMGSWTSIGVQGVATRLPLFPLL